MNPLTSSNSPQLATLKGLTDGLALKAPIASPTFTGVVTTTAFVIDTATYSGRAFSRAIAIAANSSVVLGPTGTGYISAQMPDGTTTGGNQRGTRSVDLQMSRIDATNVASGSSSTISGGDSCKASGNYSANVGGQYNAATGQFTVTGGTYCTASGDGAASFGYISTASGVGSFASGFFGVASGSYSHVSGIAGVANKYGQRTHASQNFSAVGDCQASNLFAGRATSNATPANLFLDGSSARLTVPANSTGRCTIRLAARTNTAGAQWATGDRIVSWSRGVAVGTTAISAIDTIGIDRGSNAGVWPIGWALAITADVANGAIDIQVTGAAATNIRWGASISDFTEVTFA